MIYDNDRAAAVVRWRNSDFEVREGKKTSTTIHLYLCARRVLIQFCFIITAREQFLCIFVYLRLLLSFERIDAMMTKKRRRNKWNRRRAFSLCTDHDENMHFFIVYATATKINFTVMHQMHQFNTLFSFNSNRTDPSQRRKTNSSRHITLTRVSYFIIIFFYVCDMILKTTCIKIFSHIIYRQAAWNSNIISNLYIIFMLLQFKLNLK